MDRCAQCAGGGVAPNRRVRAIVIALVEGRPSSSESSAPIRPQRAAEFPLELLDPSYVAESMTDEPRVRTSMQSLVTAREQLRVNALCRLPGFFSTAGLEALQAEVRDTLLPRLQPMASLTTTDADDKLRPSSPDVTKLRTKRFLPGRAFPRTSLLRRLFESDELEALVSALMGQRMYRSIDLDRALNLSVYTSGGTFGAHFDENAAVVSLPLLTSSLGGEFQWAPFCRADQDSGVDGVAADGGVEQRELVKRIFGGRGSDASDVLRSHRVVAGELLLFNGNRSLHRVCTVGAEWKHGTPPGFVAARVMPGQMRVAALFSYSRQPNFWWSHVRQHNEELDPGYATDVLPEYLHGG